MLASPPSLPSFKIFSEDSATSPPVELGSAMKSLRALFGLAVVVGMVYGGALFLPLYFNNYQFQDDLNTESHFYSTGTRNKDDEAIRQAGLEKGHAYKVKLHPGHIPIDHSRDAVW